MRNEQLAEFADKVRSHSASPLTWATPSMAAVSVMCFAAAAARSASAAQRLALVPEPAQSCFACCRHEVGPVLIDDEEISMSRLHREEADMAWQDAFRHRPDSERMRESCRSAYRIERQPRGELAISSAGYPAWESTLKGSDGDVLSLLTLSCWPAFSCQPLDDADVTTLELDVHSRSGRRAMLRR